MPPLSGSIFQKPAKKGVWKIKICEQLPGSKIPLLAIHKITSHTWEDAPRKVNNDEPDLRFFHGNFWPVISRTVRKPCFSTSIPRGPNLCILDFQTPPAPPPDEFSNPDPGPSQRTQGWNTSARKPSLLTSVHHCILSTKWDSIQDPTFTDKLELKSSGLKLRCISDQPFEGCLCVFEVLC